MKKAIGIIGGMGPSASARFYQMLIYYAQKDYHISKNEDYPEIYLGSFPVPDFITSQDRQNDALNILSDRIKRMEPLPISFYCMTCNTGHLLLDDLLLQTDKPFVSLFESVKAYLKETHINKVGLLASPTTIHNKVYEELLCDAGIEVIIPSLSDTKILGDIILDTVAGNNMQKNTSTIKIIADRLVQSGAEGILEACTEIPLIFPKQYLVPTFDTLEILAKAVLYHYYLLQ